MLGFERLERRHRVREREYFVAFGAQRLCDHLHHGQLVVHHEDFGHIATLVLSAKPGQAYGLRSPAPHAKPPGCGHPGGGERQTPCYLGAISSLILKIGRNIQMAMPPTVTPRKTISS